MGSNADRQGAERAPSELTTVAPSIKHRAICNVLIAGQQEGRRIVGQHSFCDVAGDELSARDAITPSSKNARDVGAFDRNGPMSGRFSRVFI
jgi:hypothetical protein